MHPFRSVKTIRATPMMLAVACVCSQLASAQSDLAFEPYPVFVVQEEAYARCGPSDEYYRTDPLRHGQEVEVFAETEDGWLGIRPPQDSFCWIPAETVEMDSSDQTGVVIEDKTVAWIGTHLGRARSYRWQVQLANGEPVTVIGRSEREGPDGPQLWFRIVPPSGEYRWVHRDHVVTSSEELVASIRRQTGGHDAEGSARNRTITNSRPTRPESARDAVSELQTTASSRRTSPKRKSVATSGPSILESKAAVGSGLNENWKSADDSIEPPEIASRPAPAPTTAAEAMKQGGLLASVEFLTRPRLIEIGGAPLAPRAGETAVDTNWVSGAGRTAAQDPNSAHNGPVTSFAGTPATSATGSILQVSGQQPIGPTARLAAPAATVNPPKVVSAERIAQIEAETRGADFERLSLILSRLMATQATAAETQPLARALHNLASTSSQPVVAGRARLLAERAEQYRRVANRRDGEAVIRSIATPVIPASGVVPASHPVPTGPVDSSNGYSEPAAAETSTHSGYLVQVYSARSNSPPFALTDNTGRTVAYVTPSPGVNLRVHLNSKVSVFGSPGFLTGLNTPHILATQAVRTPQ